MSNLSGVMELLAIFTLLFFASAVSFNIGEGNPKEIGDFPENEMFLVEAIDTNNTEEKVYLLIVPYNKKITTPQFYRVSQKDIHSNITIGMRIMKINGVIQEV